MINDNIYCIYVTLLFKKELLYELVNDSECRLVGSSCGENMVLQIFSKFNESCVDICVCAKNFMENDIGCVQCDWDEDNHDDNNGDNNDNISSTVSFFPFLSFHFK